MIGIIITPSARPPAYALNCLNGITATPYTNTPMTIDGTPLRVSAANRIVDAKRLPWYSDTYTPLRIPIGTANSDPRPERISVPTMAFAMPPPASPTGVGMCVKKATFSD